MTNLPNHIRNIGKQKSFCLYEDQYKKLEDLSKTKSFMSDVVRRGVDLALDEYYRLTAKESEGNDNR